MKTLKYKGFTVRQLKNGYSIKSVWKFGEEVITYTDKFEKLTDLDLWAWNMAPNHDEYREFNRRLVTKFEDEYNQELIKAYGA